jgi:3',5'-cyclic-AMP phosphodiesterase
MKDKYLWFTDTHLDKVPPWSLTRFILHIVKEDPKGVILTGDIANGMLTCWYLKLLAKFIKCNIYFVLGNHDYHFHSIEEMHKKIRALCKEHPNLIWMTDAGVLHINEEVAFIGAEGWYDADNGKPEYLKMTFDWFMVEDFKKLPDMKARIEAWQELAAQSADDLTDKLEKAIEQGYKSIYVLTHFPPWKEATRDVGTFMEKFWLPYNANLRLGRALEKVMYEHKKKYITVLAGHTHTDCWIHVSRNIECKVSKAKYYGELRNEEHLFI